MSIQKDDYFYAVIFKDCKMLKIKSTIVPKVVFNYNQHRSHLVLVVKKDLKLFNMYCAQALSLDEKKYVLDNVALNEIKL